jgi:hypothetical protein
MAPPAAKCLTLIEAMISLNPSSLHRQMRHSLPGERTANGARKLCLRSHHDNVANRNDRINGNCQKLSTPVDSNTLCHRAIQTPVQVEIHERRPAHEGPDAIYYAPKDPGAVPAAESVKLNRCRRLKGYRWTLLTLRLR